MSKKEKLLKRLLTNPKNFAFDELVTLLHYFGYELFNKGKTSGSRVIFISNETNNPIELHKPHPSNILKPYQIRKVISHLKEDNKI